MTKIKDLSVIETDWISSQIKFLKHQQNHNKNDDELNWKIAYLESIQSKLKPLEPIVKDALDHAYYSRALDMTYQATLEEYLNKEINL
jgi:hypothetical protein